MIDKAFININRLLALSFKNDDDDPKRNSFGKYYMPLFKITDLNALIDNKPFLIDSQKINKKHMKSLLKYQEIMFIQLETYQIIRVIKIIINSLQANMAISQQINLKGKLEDENGGTMFLLLKPSKTLF